MSDGRIFLDQLVLKAIGQRVSEIVNEEAERASERVTNRIRQEAAAISMSVMKYFTAHMMQDEVVIRIDTRGLDKPTNHHQGD